MSDSEGEIRYIDGLQSPRDDKGRFVQGHSGNPSGKKKSAGWTIIDWINELQDTPEPELERIARDRSESPAKRAAAIEWIDRLASSHDLSDFEAYLEGKMDLKSLKKTGVPTRLLKRVKAITSVSSDGNEEKRREIEVNDRGGQALDRILDRTVGKAIARNEHSGPDGGPIPMTFRVILEDSEKDE